MRKTFTDYIDDISTTYYFDAPEIINNNTTPTPKQLLSDPTMSHKPNMQRGDEKNNDWYNYTGITITYKFDLLHKQVCNELGW